MIHGMGVAYKAQQRSLHRIVALKMVLAGQKDRSGRPIVRLGQKLTVSMSLEASGELAAGGEWASNTAAPIKGYVLEPPTGAGK
jgi:hypothetical protein